MGDTGDDDDDVEKRNVLLRLARADDDDGLDEIDPPTRLAVAETLLGVNAANSQLTNPQPLRGAGGIDDPGGPEARAQIEDLEQGLRNRGGALTDEERKEIEALESLAEAMRHQTD
jgi:hypothetical protein